LRLASTQAVDCWIGVVQQTDRRLVRLAGRLSVAQVPELLEACAEVFPIELNLADLVSADMAGIEALQRLRDQGATLVSAPGYLQLKLDSSDGQPTAPLPPRSGRSKGK
jgi:CheY-like chemotaxis protein